MQVIYIIRFSVLDSKYASFFQIVTMCGVNRGAYTLVNTFFLFLRELIADFLDTEHHTEVVSLQASEY